MDPIATIPAALAALAALATLASRRRRNAGRVRTRPAPLTTTEHRAARRAHR